MKELIQELILRYTERLKNPLPKNPYYKSEFEERQEIEFKILELKCIKC